MINPKYQDVKASNLPKISKDGIHLKVISGRFNDFVSPLKTIVPTLILDFQLEKGAHFTQPIP
jgi:quercetin 2,3-dioxygenase